MKIYVAAPWVRRYEAITIGRRLQAEGHEITARWFEHPGNSDDSTGASLTPEERRRQAMEDIEDVRRADYLVVLNLELSEGKAVETGIALDAGVPVISVGPRLNIFQSLCEEVDTVEDMLQFLRTHR